MGEKTTWFHMICVTLAPLFPFIPESPHTWPGNKWDFICDQQGRGRGQSVAETGFDNTRTYQQQQHACYCGDRETQLPKTRQGGQGHHHHHHFLSHGE